MASRKAEANQEPAVKLQDAASAAGAASTMTRIVCLISVFLVRLEVSVLTLAIPQIASEFEVSFELAAWVHLGPNFAATMTAPSVGKLADMHSPEIVFHWAILFLSLNTWLAAWSPSVIMLMCARVGTGLAQSGVFAPCLAIMARGLDPSKRGVVSSQIMTADTLGSSVGMLVGGIVIDHVSWRWIFLAPAPFMTLAWVGTLVSFSMVPNSKKSISSESTTETASNSRWCANFDWLGTVLFAAGSFCLMFSVNRGNDVGWGSPLVSGLVAAASVQLLLLAYVEKNVAKPILPIWLFAGRSRIGLVCILTLASGGYASSFLLMPLFMQDARGMSTTLISKMLAARPLTAFTTSAVMSRILHRGVLQKITLVRVGSVLCCCSYALLSVVGALPVESTFVGILELQVVLQAMGHFMTTLSSNALLVASIPENEIANANAMQRVLSAIFSLMVSTANLSLVRAMGSEFVAESWRVTWIVIVFLGVAMVIATCALPANVETAYTTVSEEPEEPEEDVVDSVDLISTTIGKSSAEATPEQVLEKAPLQGNSNNAKGVSHADEV